MPIYNPLHPGKIIRDYDISLISKHATKILVKPLKATKHNTVVTH
jgi:hypothetical protein